MARLLKTPYPIPAAQNPTEERATVKQLFADGKAIRFPWADGYAIYFVKSVSPPVLQHVPVGDAWRIPYAHIRGVRAADIRDMLDADRRQREFFAKRRAN